jgi:hypothetical protein
LDPSRSLKIIVRKQKNRKLKNYQKAFNMDFLKQRIYLKIILGILFRRNLNGQISFKQKQDTLKNPKHLTRI